MSERKRTALPPEKEAEFRTFYARHAKANRLDQDPDSPAHKYDYRGAFLAGEGPSGKEGRQHWPSRFKDDDHPNRYVSDPNVGGGMLDSKYDKPVSRNRQPEILRRKMRELLRSNPQLDEQEAMEMVQRGDR